MHFVTDEHISTRVVEFLRASGHEVVRVVEVFPPKTADHVIAAYADSIRATVVTSNKKDFERFISRKAPERPRKYRHAGLITINCKTRRELDRLRDAFSLLEHEVKFAAKHLSDKRIILEIGEDFIRTHR
jgi:predicted nuclease of predicted toxin-antitoxin system